MLYFTGSQFLWALQFGEAILRESLHVFLMILLSYFGNYGSSILYDAGIVSFVTFFREFGMRADAPTLLILFGFAAYTITGYLATIMINHIPMTVYHFSDRGTNVTFTNHTQPYRANVTLVDRNITTYLDSFMINLPGTNGTLGYYGNVYDRTKTTYSLLSTDQLSQLMANGVIGFLSSIQPSKDPQCGSDRTTTTSIKVRSCWTDPTVFPQFAFTFTSSLFMVEDDKMSASLSVIPSFSAPAAINFYQSNFTVVEYFRLKNGSSLLAETRGVTLSMINVMHSDSLAPLRNLSSNSVNFRYAMNAQFDRHTGAYRGLNGTEPPGAVSSTMSFKDTLRAGACSAAPTSTSFSNSQGAAMSCFNLYVNFYIAHPANGTQTPYPDCSQPGYYLSTEWPHTQANGCVSPSGILLIDLQQTAFGRASVAQVIEYLDVPIRTTYHTYDAWIGAQLRTGGPGQLVVPVDSYITEEVGYDIDNCVIPFVISVLGLGILRLVLMIPPSLRYRALSPSIALVASTVARQQDRSIDTIFDGVLRQSVTRDRLRRGSPISYYINGDVLVTQHPQSLRSPMATLLDDEDDKTILDDKLPCLTEYKFSP
ncbi:hypothetical protein DM01DRAFT_1410635 [Hesseltinella vesiculosa]|uniref:Uncharacterized protein n=1 Tax=Hesseltinella vesiculosa TaxID=101127 RepID=A0A1X2G6D0_9FUNG|nr:hypothetical protein DM01DRAFT_1410635 [Hesseltinella vesiculosa]